VVLKPTLAGDMGAEESDNHRYEIVTSSQKIPPYLKVGNFTLLLLGAALVWEEGGVFVGCLGRGENGKM